MTTLNIPNSFSNSAVIDPVPMNANFAAVEAAVEASLALDGTVALTGQLRSLAGTAAAPGYSFATDLDVGMFLKALNELGFTTNGALAFYLDAAKKGWFQGAVDVAGVLGVTGAATLASTLTMSNAANRATFAESLAQVGAGFGAISGISTAATVNLATITSRYAVLNGAGTITSFGNSGSTSAGVYLIKAGAAITLTHSGTLILPNGANLVLADNDHVMMRDAGANVWQVIGVFRNSSGAPTVQRFTSGSGTYTRPSACTWIEVEIAGGGGGGANGSAAGATNGADTSFASWTAIHGNAGASSGGAGGSGGAAGSGTLISRQPGAAGQANSGVSGGTGGSSALSGAGAGALAGGFPNGISAAANSGSGGGGAAGAAGGGSGGGAEVVRFFMTAAQVGASASYSIGSGGAGGTGANTGGNGAAGIVTVKEYYS